MNEKGGSCEPDLRLMGHDKEGYGLSWSQFKEGYLLSGSNDCKICLWDVSAMPRDKVLNATHVYEVFGSYPFHFVFIMIVFELDLLMKELVFCACLFCFSTWYVQC